MSRRVVVTGMGFVSSVGLDAKSTWAAILAGRHGLRRLSLAMAIDQKDWPASTT